MGWRREDASSLTGPPPGPGAGRLEAGHLQAPGLQVQGHCQPRPQTHTQMYFHCQIYHFGPHQLVIYVHQYLYHSCPPSPPPPQSPPHRRGLAEILEFGKHVVGGQLEGVGPVLSTRARPAPPALGLELATRLPHLYWPVRQSWPGHQGGLLWTGQSCSC